MNYYVTVKAADGSGKAPLFIERFGKEKEKHSEVADGTVLEVNRNLFSQENYLLVKSQLEIGILSINSEDTTDFREQKSDGEKTENLILQLLTKINENGLPAPAEKYKSNMTFVFDKPVFNLNIPDSIVSSLPKFLFQSNFKTR